MTPRSRVLAILLAILITLPATVGWRGVAQVSHCCGLPSNIRTAADGWPADAAPPDQQTLTLGFPEYHYFDWEQTAYDLNDIGSDMTQELLIRPDNNFNPLPAGATSWSVDKSGKVWTFHLRHGMVWSDGTPITANDWLFSFQRYARADYDFDSFYSIIKNLSKIAAGKAPMSSLGVKVIDPYTLQITTETPAAFLIGLMETVTLTPKKAFDKYGAKWSTRPDWMLFSGPYVVQSWQHGVQYTLVPNPRYTGPYKPFFRKVTVKIMQPQAIFPAYRNGEIDVIPSSYESIFAPSNLALIEHDPVLKAQYHRYLDFMTWYLFFDMQSAPFNNLKVRQAFSHVIDRDALTRSVLAGDGVPAYAMLPPGFPGWNENELKGIQAYNPALGAKLLAEAGYPNGKGFPHLTLILREPNPQIVEVAGAIKAELKQNLNIDVDVQQLDYATFSTRLSTNKIKLGLVPYEYDFVDPYNLLRLFMTQAPAGEGRHNWNNSTYDALIHKANALGSSPAARIAVVKQAERLLVQQVAGVFLWHPYISELWKPYYAGYTLQCRSFGLDWSDDRLGLSYYTIYKTKSPVTYKC